MFQEMHIVLVSDINGVN